VHRHRTACIERRQVVTPPAIPANGHTADHHSSIGTARRPSNKHLYRFGDGHLHGRWKLISMGIN
jgi:hypothetical protein